MIRVTPPEGKTVDDVLWDGVPYFENDQHTLRIVAVPGMAYWMVKTLLWLVDPDLVITRATLDEEWEAARQKVIADTLVRDAELHRMLAALREV